MNCYPSYTGMIIADIGSTSKKKFLPPYIDNDEEIDRIPLSVQLDNHELEELTAKATDNVSACSATHYGSREQEKMQNEDFSFSAIIQNKNGEAWAFAVVADGVSTKTFWAARTARIACLVAYKVMRRFIQEESNPSIEIIKKLRDDLADQLQISLKKDKLHLMARGEVPKRWKEEIYLRCVPDDKFWYNSTLIISALGPKYGIVLFVGDGGLVVVRTDSNGNRISKTVIKSSDDVAIDTFVSLAVKGTDFGGGLINYDSSLTKLEVFLSSDGVDRSLQRMHKEYADMPPSYSSRNICYDEIQKILKEPRGIQEIDNHSLAKIEITFKSKQSKQDMQLGVGTSSVGQYKNQEMPKEILQESESPKPKTTQKILTGMIYTTVTLVVVIVAYGLFMHKEEIITYLSSIFPEEASIPPLASDDKVNQLSPATQGKPIQPTSLPSNPVFSPEGISHHHVNMISKTTDLENKIESLKKTMLNVNFKEENREKVDTALSDIKNDLSILKEQIESIHEMSQKNISQPLSVDQTSQNVPSQSVPTQNVLPSACSFFQSQPYSYPSGIMHSYWCPN